jgi:hypothetical protein
LKVAGDEEYSGDRYSGHNRTKFLLLHRGPWSNVSNSDLLGFFVANPELVFGNSIPNGLFILPWGKI